MNRLETDLAGQSSTQGAVPLLSFEQIAMTFPDGTEAIAGIDLSVAPGELVAVVGPSGCGKSTLLRIASGLTTASRGRVTVRSEQLGYVFQDATLLPWRTVLGNVELPAELRKIPKTERRVQAEQAIQLVGLTGFEHHHPRQLSGGMRMRVSLARALTLDPSVFLFDEPFGALDEITRERMNDELLQLFMRKRFAGLFVTHSIYEAAFLARRVVVLSPRPGRVSGEVDVPFGYPRSPALRFEPSFAEITSRISGLLRESHQ
ncbi:MAG: NitT/TauT family transport system ATP-binding protein [Acidimicrobiaceae bacterium]|jgi:NitT/TauT family transport system ATP-binding protein|nr:NitT/TauT family transport system ATP-binding protein [Acidimicrobiaceae bacterium]